MTFKYKAIDNTGAAREGTVEAVSIEVAITTLQKRGFVISNITPESGGSFLERNISFFDRVSNKDIVILSRQMATLFEAQVSALRVFRLLAVETESSVLRKILQQVADDLQGGSAISNALSKHPKAFSSFYVSMVRSGEESGKLDQTFLYLADYLDRTYEVTSKVKNALIYPAFVVFTFVAVMALMLTVVIPKISAILTDSGQEIPFYTKIVLALSNFFVDYGLFVILALVVGIIFLWRYTTTAEGRESFDRMKISTPLLSVLYKKLYLSRIADNMNTMLDSGIPMVRGLEITASIVGNQVYSNVLTQTLESVKGGSSLSDALAKFPEIPGIMVQMIRVGEETGELGAILKTLATFYRREVIGAVDTLVDLIEPTMIVLLGLGVGFLLAAVLIPIYNISSAM
ncbi:MAG: type II secretion system F family protein [Candidatus Paceibacterota bacterium]|jgi:type IV pilus assembly protein PilC